MLKTNTRVLLNNGISVVDVDELASLLATGEDVPPHLKTEKSPDTEKFKEMYDIELSTLLEDIELVPKFGISKNDELFEYLVSTRRDDIDDEDHINRVQSELNFFIDSETVDFLHVVRNLIKTFKKNDILWGTGRGSSCASYVLYLLEAHDINPIQYQIDFREFSKEE